MNRCSLTGHLRALEREIYTPRAAVERFEFADGRYTIRAANDFESRKTAYELIYQLYLEKEYAKPHSSKMWLSIYDALPETVTLLVEKNETTDYRLRTTGKTVEACGHPSLSPELQPVACSLQPTAVGALTVVFDSPMGLPADKVYGPELDGLRASGRRLAEVVSLGVAEEAQAGSQVLLKLFNFAYFIARGVRDSTDFVVTVNPRHVRFYERLMCFAEAGPECSYDKVGGAPAVLLRLDFDVAERRRRAAVSGEAVSRHSIYRQFRAVSEEPETAARLARQLRPMSDTELGRFFIAETDLLARATPVQRAIVQERYLPRDPMVDGFG